MCARMCVRVCVCIKASCLCVCVCVCVRDRQADRQKEREIFKSSLHKQLYYVYKCEQYWRIAGIVTIASIYVLFIEHSVLQNPVSQQRQATPQPVSMCVLWGEGGGGGYVKLLILFEGSFHSNDFCVIKIRTVRHISWIV